jgi:hypothetical protein
MFQRLKNKQQQWLPTLLIEKAISEEWINSLAYFVILKSKYQNQTIYNYSNKKVAQVLNVSYNTAKFHIDKLISENLCRVHNGNLTLNGIEKLKKQTINKLGHETKLLSGVFIKQTKKEQVEELRASIIVKNLKRQEYRISQKSATLSYAEPSRPKSKSEYRAIKNGLKKMNQVGGVGKFEKTLNKRTMLSNFKFGHLINRSRSTGKRFQKRLRELNVINSERNIVLLQSNATIFDFNHINYKNPSPSNLYIKSKKEIVKQTANVITLNHRLCKNA